MYGLEGPLRVQFIASKLAYVLRQNDKIAVQATGFPQKWEQRWNKDSTQAFALDIASVRHYDMRGVETRVQLEDVDGSFLDPLGKVELNSLIEHKSVSCQLTPCLRVAVGEQCTLYILKTLSNFLKLRRPLDKVEIVVI